MEGVRGRLTKRDEKLKNQVMDVILDFAFFPALKNDLRGKRFHNLTEIRRKVSQFTTSLGQHWFRNVFSAWVKGHEKCLSHRGRYFEKE